MGEEGDGNGGTGAGFGGTGVGGVGVGCGFTVDIGNFERVTVRVFAYRFCQPWFCTAAINRRPFVGSV